MAQTYPGEGEKPSSAHTDSRPSQDDETDRAGEPTHSSQAPPPRPPGAINSVVADRIPVDWNAVVGDNRVVLLGEDHKNAPIRDFLAGQARAMREAGITHYGIEAPANPAFDELNAGRYVDLTGVKLGPLGYPRYEQAIRAMRAEGITIVPLDLDHSLPLAAGARDRHMADTITAIVSKDPNAKVAGLLGDFHTTDMHQDGWPRAGAILQAGPHSTTTVGFSGGTDTYGILAHAARKNDAGYETFLADLRDYHDAGGSFSPHSAAHIHLPQYGYPSNSSFGW